MHSLQELSSGVGSGPNSVPSSSQTVDAFVKDTASSCWHHNSEGGFRLLVIVRWMLVSDGCLPCAWIGERDYSWAPGFPYVGRLSGTRAFVAQQGVSSSLSLYTRYNVCILCFLSSSCSMCPFSRRTIAGMYKAYSSCFLFPPTIPSSNLDLSYTYHVHRQQEEERSKRKSTK